MTAETTVTPGQHIDFGAMTLRSSLTSPYGRKTRMAALVLGLMPRITVVTADTRDADDDLRQQNPLGKIPCLILGNGEVLYDSRVILEYFDALAGGGKLMPTGGFERYRALTLATLADGVADAALLTVYEGRFREPHQASEVWLSHQRGKITRGLAALAATPPDAETTDIASISLACALSYFDWRKPYDWRPEFPALVQWLERFAAVEPTFLATRRPEEVGA